jgi:hypothetical protein
VYGIKRSHCRLGERTSGSEQTAVQRKQVKRVQHIARAFDQAPQRQSPVMSDCAADCPRQLGEHEFA